MKSSLKQNSVSYSASLSVMNGRTGSVFFLLLSLLMLAVTFVKPDAVGGVRLGINDVITPAISIISKPFQIAAESLGGVTDKAALRAENTKLQAENERLRQWYQTALMLQAENQSLQKLLNFKINNDMKFVTARVVSDSGNAFVKTFLVNVGQTDGIRKNQAVLAGEGLIGRIIESGQNAARVLLMTDINSRIPVIVEGTNQKAILTGDNNDFPLLKHLPKDSGLIQGMRLVTSGDGGIFPYGLPIGKVFTDNGTHKVKPFADINRVTFVRILDMPASPNLIKGDIYFDETNGFSTTKPEFEREPNGASNISN